MHTLLLVLSVLLLVPGSVFAFWLVRRFNGWTWHRHLHLLILSVPVVSLGLNLFAVDHFVGQTCFTTAPRWDIVLSLLLVLSMSLVALVGISAQNARTLCDGRWHFPLSVSSHMEAFSFYLAQSTRD